MLQDGDIGCNRIFQPQQPSLDLLGGKRELQVIGELATKYDAVVMEDLAYFCMDYRRDLGHPYKLLYPLWLDTPTIASCCSRRVRFLAMPANASRWYVSTTNSLKPTIPHCRNATTTQEFSAVRLLRNTLYDYQRDAASTQYGYAEMLRLSCEGKINFIKDTREPRASCRKMKEIFCRHGFR